MSDDHTRASRPADHADLAVGWVLHVLDPDQEAEFLAHLELEDCAECAAVIAETAGAFEDLARAVPQEDPPPGLRHRLLLAAEAERPDTAEPPAMPVDVPATGTTRSGNGVGNGGHARPDALPPGVAPLGTDATSDRSDPPVPPPGVGATVIPMRRRVGRALTAVAAAVVVVVLGGLVVINQSLRDDRDQQAATAQQYARVVDVMRDAGAPGAVSAPLAEPGGALVGLVVDRGSGPEVLSTHLGVNRSDETYVLWALAGAAPRPVGTFDVPDVGASVRSVPSSPAAGPVAGYAVSLEPGRTAPAAPTRIVASGQVGR